MSEQLGRNPKTTRQPRLFHVVFETLRDQIEDGTLPAGLILEAAPLARFFGISRTPVKEALEELIVAGLAQPGEGRGIVVGRGSTPFRQDLSVAGLRLPQSAQQNLSNRNWRSRIYPEIEQEIASCLPFGRFAISVTQLATSKGVSRTIAHEALVQLERLELIRQHGTRWYAGPMSERDILEHYEIRWLLEPRALATSAETLPQKFLLDARARAIDCLNKSANAPIELIDRLGLERELHIGIVLHSPSRLMAEAIRRSQLPLIATHFSLNFQRDQTVRRQMIVEHLAVIEALVANDISSAATALEVHLRSAPDIVLEALHSRETRYVPQVYMTRDE